MWCRSFLLLGVLCDGRIALKDLQETTLVQPYFDYVRDGHMLPKATAGTYDISGTVHQIVKAYGDYRIMVEDLPEGVELLETTLNVPLFESRLEGQEVSGAFNIQLQVYESVPSGSYPFTIRLLDGDQEVSRSRAIVPVETVVDHIRVVAFNDFHGYIMPQVSSGIFRTGALSMTVVLEEMQANNHTDNFIVVGNGDTIGASLFESAINNDDPTKEIAKLWGTECQALGNHEFDKGWEDVLDAQEKFGFPQLGANIFRNSDGSVFTQSVYVRDVGNYKVGFVGVTLESLAAEVGPSAIEGLNVQKPGPIAAQLAQDLKDDGCNIVVALYHQGYNYSSQHGNSDLDRYMDGNPEAELTEFLTTIENSAIDALMTGHTHAYYSFTSSSNKSLPPVVQANCCGENWGVFDFQIDRGTRTLVGAPNSFTRWTSQSITYDYSNDQWMDGSTVLDEANMSPLLVKVNNVVKQAKKDADERGSVSQGRSDITWPAPSGSETILGAHVADALLAAGVSEDSTTAISIINDAAMAVGWVPVDGHILVRQVYEVLPNEYTLVLLSLTGADIRALLEQQWLSVDASARVLQLGGMRYEFNDENDIGSRVDPVTMEYYDGTAWQQITTDGVYRVATTAFLAGGGASFSEFTKATNIQRLSLTDIQACLQYNQAVASENDNVIVPPALERGINQRLDRTSEIEYTYEIEYSGSDVTVTFVYTVQAMMWGPFKATLYHEGTSTLVETVLPTEAISPSAPLRASLTTSYGPESLPWLQFGLYHTQFDESPLPRGIEERFQLEHRDVSSSAGVHYFVTAGILGSLVALTVF
eukprot:Protomagalhaensia_wolfi_Nauph_80__5594@NODE_62_length_4092_cov_134_022453_g51_i0_p1_GENE_NODE_62_length_4092_cov_134_022453_g51_i0NODE_62_length_4092_cov_134_022453_g51_i0_p1_ORF_typecomplete_len815_score157_965_nucleotid_C/PF02872_18/5_9e22Metallophos/PF00149_28/2_9e06PGA_cap/PF09587_10/6e03PGA_cap/PF09587_10/1_8e05TcfC/PF16967_5/6_6e03TcfC/PF16967_5/0_037_NODE_62_length_4092_cov_134_022453_g51_i013893833